jgi:hypothetical protein
LQYRWDELTDYANASRLFATDPQSSVEAIALHDHVLPHYTVDEVHSSPK